VDLAILKHSVCSVAELGVCLLECRSCWGVWTVWIPVLHLLIYIPCFLQSARRLAVFCEALHSILNSSTSYSPKARCCRYRAVHLYSLADSKANQRSSLAGKIRIRICEAWELPQCLIPQTCQTGQAGS